MKILITGATGFIGSHIARQLLAAGEEVRLLVRSAEQARSLYGAESGVAPEIVQADITDRSAVVQALKGCQGVVHAAAGTPMKIDSVERLFAVNVGGVKNIVESALQQGVRHIVCISSITAIFNKDGAKVTAEAAPIASKMPYGQSKVEAELLLRELQDEGAPIAVIYPGGVLGPDDPGFSDSCRALKYRIENGFRLFGEGGMQYIDVRDLAALACALVIDGGSGRFLAPGIYSPWAEQADAIEAVSGCELKRIPAQGWKLRLVGRLLDLLRLFRSVDSPISAETMRYATLWPNIRNSEEFEKRGLCLRPQRQTFDDTLRWMVRDGYLDALQCPKSAQGTSCRFRRHHRA